MTANIVPVRQLPALVTTNKYQVHETESITRLDGRRQEFTATLDPYPSNAEVRAMI
jgi:hypothetical protein